MSRPAWLALGGLFAGAVCATQLTLGAEIADTAQRLVGAYELAAPVMVFSILGPSFLRLLRQDAGEVRRFSVFTVVWFSALRLAVCLVATAAIVAVYSLPLRTPPGQGASESTSPSVIASVAGSLVESRYMVAIAGAGFCAWLLRRRTGFVAVWFLRLPDLVEAAGNVLTRMTALFGFLVGLYIVSLPGVLLETIRGMDGATLQPIDLGFLQFDTATPHGLLVTYLAVSAVTAILCFVLHGALVVGCRLRISGFSVRGYLSGYLARVYPLIWSTGSESLAIPANVATLRRYGGAIPARFRDFAAGAAAALNMNGSLICCLVLIPAVCMTIGYPLSAMQLLACLPLIFVLGYGVPGIPGELVVFADPIAGALGLAGTQREIFLLLFLSWQIGLTDSFRSAGSATDAVPATLLLTESYYRRFRIRNAQGRLISNPATPVLTDDEPTALPQRPAQGEVHGH